MKDPNKRLGNLGKEAKEVKAHPWFKNVLWSLLLVKKLKPPMQIKLNSKDDTTYISNVISLKRNF